MPAEFRRFAYFVPMPGMAVTMFLDTILCIFNVSRFAVDNAMYVEFRRIRLQPIVYLFSER